MPHTNQAQPRPDVEAPPAMAVSWLVETEVAGEHRFALVFARTAFAARQRGARVLEQQLVEHVTVKPSTFKGFSNRGEG
jgi:hypothetical protein